MAWVLPFLLTLSLLVNGVFIVDNVKRNLVTNVIDGDSLELASGQRIRLLGIDAPERGRCMADEARMRLNQLTKGRIIRLTDRVTDDYGRTLTNVYVGNILVNKILVGEGLAKFTSVASSQYEGIKLSGSDAKAYNLGIYSSKCRQTDPSNDCDIKGNMRAKIKTYYLPTCRDYNSVIIDTSFGDEWFCSETAANKHGYTKAARC